MNEPFTMLASFSTITVSSRISKLRLNKAVDTPIIISNTSMVYVCYSNTQSCRHESIRILPGILAEPVTSACPLLTLTHSHRICSASPSFLHSLSLSQCPTQEGTCVAVSRLLHGDIFASNFVFFFYFRALIKFSSNRFGYTGCFPGKKNNNKCKCAVCRQISRKHKSCDSNCFYKLFSFPRHFFYLV